MKDGNKLKKTDLDEKRKQIEDWLGIVEFFAVRCLIGLLLLIDVAIFFWHKIYS